MFVKTTRVKRDNKSYEYLSLVEAVRDGAQTGHRVLFRLGEAEALRRSGELDRIVAALRAHCAQHLSAERALCELGRIRAVTLTAGEATIDVVTRRSALQTRILAALGVDTSGWERPRIS